MSQLSVSVVMAVRNGERFLEEAFASIFQSQRRPLEILLIDGGSSDRTARIAAAQPLTRVIAQKGRGIADAYNCGIAEAEGDVIAFLSHDDLWSPGKLDRQLAGMEADPTLMLTVGMVRHVLVDEAPPGFRMDLLDRDVPGYIMETLIARREAFELVGGFDTGFATAEDVDWFARVNDAGLTVGLLPEVVLIKRVHDTNASLTDINGRHDLFRALRHAARRRQRRLA